MVAIKAQHEQFALAVAGLDPGKTPADAYVSVYGPSRGAAQSAARLLKNAQVSRRVAQLREQIGSQLLARTIQQRDYRLEMLQKRYDLLWQIVRERGLEYEGLSDLAALEVEPAAGGDVLDRGALAWCPVEAFTAWSQRYPMLARTGISNTRYSVEGSMRGCAAGGSTGFLVRDYKGLGALMPVFKVDTGLLSELRAIERQAAEELGQWQQSSQVNVTVNMLVAKLVAGRERAARMKDEPRRIA